MKKNIIVCLVCVCLFIKKKVIKNTILFKDREKERIRGEKDKAVGLWEKRKKKERVWSC